MNPRPLRRPFRLPLCGQAAHRCPAKSLLCEQTWPKSSVHSPPPLSTQSSCISFSYWKETVSILLNPDRQSPSALVSYIEEPYMDIDRDFTEE